MAMTLMLFAVFISVTFLIDFTKTVLELRRDRLAMREMRREASGFHV